jgi:hypothetical protein
LDDLGFYTLEGQEISASKATAAYFRAVYPRCEQPGHDPGVRWKSEILGIFWPGWCENIDFLFQLSGNFVNLSACDADNTSSGNM